MKVISAAKQLEVMETLAGASGETCYDAIRDMMSRAFCEDYGRDWSDKYELAPIPEKQLEEFMDWLEEGD